MVEEIIRWKQTPIGGRSLWSVEHISNFPQFSPGKFSRGARAKMCMSRKYGKISNFFNFPEYRHVGCLNRGFWTRWIDSRCLFYLKTTLKHIFIHARAHACMCKSARTCAIFGFGLFLKYRHVGCLNRGFWTRLIDSRGLFYLKINFEAHFYMYARMYARAKVRARVPFLVFGLFLKYRHVWCLNRGFWTRWIDSQFNYKPLF